MGNFCSCSQESLASESTTEVNLHASKESAAPEQSEDQFVAQSTCAEDEYSVDMYSHIQGKKPLMTSPYHHFNWTETDPSTIASECGN